MSFTNEIWLAIRTAVADGSAAPSPPNPPPGSPGNPRAANTPESFGAIMSDANKVPPNTLIRLGPGVFRTRGGGGNGLVNVDPLKLWAPLSGQKIVGAGMFATTLQFVWDIPPTGHLGQAHYMILSDAYLRSFELSDLTLDCNLQNTPFDSSEVQSPPALANLTQATSR